MFVRGNGHMANDGADESPDFGDGLFVLGAPKFR
jgi:hypothetical protein